MPATPPYYATMTTNMPQHHPCASNLNRRTLTTEPRKQPATWTRQCVAKRQERKRRARATHASTRHGRFIHYEPRLRRRRGE